LDVVSLSVVTPADAPAHSQAHANRGELLGSFRCAPRVVVGGHTWPFDYLVALQRGRALARGGSGSEAILGSGDAAVWRAGEEWSVEALEDTEARTIQSAEGAQLDIGALAQQYAR
jgi:hypothetical protein